MRATGSASASAPPKATHSSEAAEFPLEAPTPDQERLLQADAFAAEQSLIAVEGDEAEQADGEANLVARAHPTMERRIPLLGGRRKGHRLVRRDDSPRTPFTPEKRLLILDSVFLWMLAPRRRKMRA